MVAVTRFGAGADSRADLGASRAELVQAIDEWAVAVAASGVPASFGWRCTAATGEGLLAQLEELGSMYWDFRSGRERNLARHPELSPEQVEAITSSAHDLGLDGTEPPSRPHYDAVLMTGGMVRAGIVKPRFVRELVDSDVSFGEVVFVGAFRPFAGDEVRLARELGVAGSSSQGGDEWDAMVTGLERAFPPTSPPVLVEHTGENRNASWRDLSWLSGQQVVRAVAAPSSDPRMRRADTADTFRFWAGRAGASAGSVLVVTTPVYVPYQAAVAVRTLGLESGLSVQTVAVSEAANDLGELTQVFEPRHRLQELLAAVRGVRALRNDLVAVAVNP
ncbi:MAG TPA: hypothetical protein PK781_10770 [Terrimesophilobacter sp.]|nr:hypothetical protein [Terrimesophilobacter sp.]